MGPSPLKLPKLHHHRLLLLVYRHDLGLALPLCLLTPATRVNAVPTSALRHPHFIQTDLRVLRPGHLPGPLLQLQ